MNDFEKAAQRLRQSRQQGQRVWRDSDSPADQAPDASANGLASLQEALRKKLREPLDVVLPENSSTIASVANDGNINLKRTASGTIASTQSLTSSDISMQNDHRDMPGISPPVTDREGVPSAIDELITVDMPANAEDGTSTPPERSLLLSFSSLSERGFITPGTAKGRLTEEYRRIKRSLLKQIKEASPGSRLNVIMVTSSVQGEGKTYNAINMAISLAQEKNRSVLLIDADVVKGTAGRELGVSENEPGLLDLLSQTYSHPNQVIMSTNIPNLAFMPAGKADEQANELLTSERMRVYIDALARESAERIIVLDCPPILQTNEANVLAEYAGQIVFIVAEQQTSQSLVQDALKHLDKDKYVGMLLNKSSGVGAEYGYGYY